ncbi:putative toxin-antitoxin system toxin component, PIN family [Brunnivagina elsteri]|uniref:Putative toxin-antitoxin system toxin component, PIN family n=1 Tax=Brunnivagina elsteri CCALA 953 TaxID=987040 RepID=A0A2A2TDG5_9CYAN|nr:putative toxin-antitoxin system toxin component, PIN family [Calothrix elsteri]PAX51459.1 putative toxin-antitoxin system toxin component, PIN family [Calothrix elsteri CCALA 953]
MKVIIDTNVLVSAVLSGRNPEFVILFIVSNPEIEWVVSAEILQEYKEVLSRKKFKLTQEQLNRWYEFLDNATVLISPRLEIDFPRDQKDAKFLACAIETNADFLITGDFDFTEAQTLIQTTIVSVSSFMKLVCDVL